MPKRVYKVESTGLNKDIPPGMDLHQAREFYLNIWDNFPSRLPEPTIEEWTDGRFILRADLAPAGLKAFAAEKLIAECPQHTLVYVAPRVGHAPDAIAKLASMYGKRCVFFCPSSKRISNHQAALLKYDNVELRFVRIAAMPVLNKYAKDWAAMHQAAFLPLGLKDTLVVTAGLVNLAATVEHQLGFRPVESHCAVSTGTMIRALEIGWPEAAHVGTAVARNIHDGEIGLANVVGYHRPFLSPSDTLPPFPTTSTYDAKAWKLFDACARPKSIFINVGSDEHIEEGLDTIDHDSVNSYREWGDLRDLSF